MYVNRRGANKVLERVDLPPQCVRVGFVETHNSQIELIEPLGENSPIVKFLEKNPAGGQHYVCFEVPDIHAAKAEMEAKGAKVLGEPRIGAHGTTVICVHPRDRRGVLVALLETPRAYGSPCGRQKMDRTGGRAK